MEEMALGYGQRLSIAEAVADSQQAVVFWVKEPSPIKLTVHIDTQGTELGWIFWSNLVNEEWTR
jgi:hypothetical protein